MEIKKGIKQERVGSKGTGVGLDDAPSQDGSKGSRRRAARAPRAELLPALCRVPLGPLPGHPVVLRPVGHVLCGDAADQRVSRVAVCQEGADGQEHFRDGEGRAPIVLQDVQADHALAVDVTVIDSGAEGHLGGFKRIVR